MQNSLSSKKGCNFIRRALSEVKNNFTASL
jgi:hypothetical protein